MKRVQIKKWQATHIAPLNHVPLLCSHPGESAGAGRVGLAVQIYNLFIFLQALSSKNNIVYCGSIKIKTKK
jgi:hypothetical protein